MNTLFTALRNVPKRTSAIALMIAAAVIVPVTLFAWGPERPTHTVENPATYITFNSITNNPDYGDERNFVRIKDASDMGPGNWKDDITVEPGKEYLVQMYVHNNAASSLNLVATNTRVMANVPTTTGKNVQIDGFITADNATPKQVWDQARFNSPTDFNVAYVPGSAKLYNKPSGINGFTLSDSIVTSSGALVGFDKLDGKVPGCFNYSGYVSFKVKPQFAKSANFTVNKQVRKTGTTGWTKSLAVNPGDSVDYLVEYKNVGEARTNNVTLKDTLPAGVSYIAGTTNVTNSTAPNGVKVMDGITTSTGVNIGDYNKDANAFTKFTAKVATADKLPICGKNTLTNTVRAVTEFGWKESTADVVVTTTCKPNDCKPGIPVGDVRCKETPPPVTPVTPVTPTTPTIPSELPKTGTTENILGVFGIGSLIAAAAYYVSSRRALARN